MYIHSNIHYYIRTYICVCLSVLPSSEYLLYQCCSRHFLYWAFAKCCVDQWVFLQKWAENLAESGSSVSFKCVLMCTIKLSLIVGCLSYALLEYTLIKVILSLISSVI